MTDRMVLSRKRTPEEIEARLRQLKVPEPNIQSHVAGLTKLSEPKPERQAIKDSDVGKKVLSAEHRANLSAAHKGKTLSEATKAKIRATLKGRVCEWRHKITAALKGRKFPERGAKVSAALRGRKLSDEHKQALREAKLGVGHSDETKAKLSAIAKAKWASPEHRANHVRSMTPEWRHAVGSGRRGRSLSDETSARISMGLKRAHNKNPVWIRSKRA